MIDLDLIQFRAEIMQMIQSMRPLGDDTTTRAEETPYGTVIEALPTETVEPEAAAEAGNAVLPAKIDSASAWRVDIYGGADGFDSAPTEENVTLDDIMNVAAGQYFPVGTELWVLTAGSKRYGLLNGVF